MPPPPRGELQLVNTEVKLTPYEKSPELSYAGKRMPTETLYAGKAPDTRVRYTLA